MAFRSNASSMAPQSTPSRMTRPPCGSTNRKIAPRREDFPAPDRPTIPVAPEHSHLRCRFNLSDPAEAQMLKLSFIAHRFVRPAAAPSLHCHTNAHALTPTPSIALNFAPKMARGFEETHLRRAGSKPSAYRSVTWCSSSRPAVGHLVGGCSVTGLSAPSLRTSVNARTRSTAVIRFSVSAAWRTAYWNCVRVCQVISNNIDR